MVGRGFVAVLATDQRGPVERRPAKTREEAFAAARWLLDQAERRDWYRGEIVSVRIEAGDG
jgi:hypothetical protein